MNRSLFVLLLSLVGCDGVASFNPAGEFDSLQAAATVDGQPEAPLVRPGLRVFEANAAGLDAKYAQPGLVSHNGEFTPDGRLMAKNQCPREGRPDGEFCLQVFRPEALAAAGSLQNASTQQLANAYSQDLAVEPARLIEVGQGVPPYTFEKGHLCMPNTRPVRAEHSSDLYDVTFVMLLSQGTGEAKRFFLAGRRATVTVRDAKSGTAAPTSVTVPADSTLEVAEIPFKNLPELNFAHDGKLAAGRYEGLARQYTWTTSDGSAREETDESLMFYLSANNACDVRQWVQNGFKPLPAAFSDSKVNTRYGFAKNPIRVMNLSGAIQPLSETDKLWGSYAWIDPTGANVIYFKSVKAAFVAAQAKGQTTPVWASGALLNGAALNKELIAQASLDGTVPVTMVVGSWTWGREVALDGRLSLADIPVAVTDSQTTSRVNVLKLPNFYRGASEAESAVELDETTRGSVASNYWGANKHLWVKSGIRFSSIANVFNYYPHMRPTTKRDVVWYVTRGHVTDEVVFDDFLDPAVLVYSEMNAAVPNDKDRALCDGSGCDSNLWVQNAATGAVFDVPSVGEVGEGVRIEPVAAGGRFGRGLWLERATTLTYRIPAARQGFTRDDWYAGISFDVRMGGTQTQTLMKVASSSGASTIVVEGQMKTDTLPARYELRLNGTPCTTVERSKWHTVAVVANGQTAKLVVDGLSAKCTVSSALSIFASKVTFGGGFRGWVDQARVVVDLGRPADGGRAGNWSDISSELFCNYAGGTLGMNGNEPVCVREGAVPSPQRETILLADSGRLFRDVPRRNTVGNPFCATCHVATNWVRDGLVAPLSLSRQALTVGTVSTPYDERRQPMQPPSNESKHLACVWGAWPVSNTALVAPGLTTPDRIDGCLPLDTMLLPAR